MSEMQKRRDLRGGIPASALGGAPVAPAKQTQLAQRRSHVARGEVVILPVYGEVWMEVLGGAVMEDIEAAVFKAMNARELPATPLHAGTYNMNRFRRVVAAAVRTVDDHREPFGTLEEWDAEPEPLVVAAVQGFMDVKSRLDPTTNATLTEAEADDIVDAFKKKDAQQLREFGSVSLVTWLLSGAVQLSISPIAASTSGDSSAE